MPLHNLCIKEVLPVAALRQPDKSTQGQNLPLLRPLANEVAPISLSYFYLHHSFCSFVLSLIIASPSLLSRSVSSTINPSTCAPALSQHLILDYCLQNQSDSNAIMADAEAEAAFLSSMQANNENAGGYNTAENDSGEQIESSDEYDPAQDVQDITLPDLQNQASVVETPLTASHTTPSNSKPVSVPTPFSPSEQNVVEDRPQTSNSMKSPISTPNSMSIMGKPAALASTNSPRSATAKARLPNDTIGILEDRIKEDEKGDIDAWLSLISEHNKRGKLDDVRKVYDRFFAIFPHAVRIVVLFITSTLTIVRLNSGSLWRNSRTKRITEPAWKRCLLST